MPSPSRLVYGALGGGASPGATEEAPRLSFRAVGGEGVQTFEAVLQRRWKCAPSQALALAAGWSPADAIAVGGINYGSGFLVTSSEIDQDSGTVTVTGTKTNVAPFETGLPKGLRVVFNSSRTSATVFKGSTSQTFTGADASGFRFRFDATTGSPSDVAIGGYLANVKNCALLFGGVQQGGGVDVASLFFGSGGYLQKVTGSEYVETTWTPILKYGDWQPNGQGTGQIRAKYETAGRTAVTSAIRNKFEPQINRALDASGVSGLCGYTFTTPGSTWQSEYNTGTATYSQYVHTWHYEVAQSGKDFLEEALALGPHWEVSGGMYRLKYFGVTLWEI